MVTARNDTRQALSASLIKVLIAHGSVHCSGASAPVPRWWPRCWNATAPTRSPPC